MVKKPKTKEKDFVPATGKYVYIEFGDIITIVSMIDQHGQANELRKLTGLEHVVRIPSQTANLVKKFIADHPEMSQDPVGMKVLRPVEGTEEGPEGTVSRSMRKPIGSAGPVQRKYSGTCGFCPGG